MTWYLLDSGWPYHAPDGSLMGRKLAAQGRPVVAEGDVPSIIAAAQAGVPVDPGVDLGTRLEQIETALAAGGGGGGYTPPPGGIPEDALAEAVRDKINQPSMTWPTVSSAAAAAALSPGPFIYRNPDA